MASFTRTKEFPYLIIVSSLAYSTRRGGGANTNRRPRCCSDPMVQTPARHPTLCVGSRSLPPACRLTSQSLQFPTDIHDIFRTYVPAFALRVFEKDTRNKSASGFPFTNRHRQQTKQHAHKYTTRCPPPSKNPTDHACTVSVHLSVSLTHRHPLRRQEEPRQRQRPRHLFHLFRPPDDPATQVHDPLRENLLARDLEHQEETASNVTCIPSMIHPSIHPWIHQTCTDPWIHRPEREREETTGRGWFSEDKGGAVGEVRAGAKAVRYVFWDASLPDIRRNEVMGKVK